MNNSGDSYSKKFGKRCREDRGYVTEETRCSSLTTVAQTRYNVRVLILLFGIFVLLLPTEALAWGPVTHLRLAHWILGNPDLLPAAMAELLAAWPDFFYFGNIAADLILGKGFRIEYHQHSHNWQVAQQLLAKAEDDREKAFAIGYLCHLSADVVAHNFYVPFFIRFGPGQPGTRHLYSEIRFDAKSDVFFWDLGHRLHHDLRNLTLPHLKQNLVETVFNHRINELLFGGQLQTVHSAGYRRFVDRMALRSRFPLQVNWVQTLNELALTAMLATLHEEDKAFVTQWDPTGAKVIKDAGACARQHRFVHEQVDLDDNFAKYLSRLRSAPAPFPDWQNDPPFEVLHGRLLRLREKEKRRDFRRDQKKERKEIKKRRNPIP